MHRYRLTIIGALVAMNCCGAVVARAEDKGTARTPAPSTKTAERVTVHGVVKGAPKGKTFVIASRKGAVTVDASKATFRERGKFTTIAAVASGIVVTARGTLNGETFMATEVMLYPRKKKAEAAPAPPAK